MRRGTCEDFRPPDVEMGVPPNGAACSAPRELHAGSLCALEPQSRRRQKARCSGNWVRPRFRVAAPAGIDLLEIRIHSPVEKNDLVVYTMNQSKAGAPATSWYLPKEIWSGPGGAGTPAAGNGFANNAAGQPVTVTIRGVNTTAPGTPVGVKGDFHIAPVVATGSMVFWTVNSASVTPTRARCSLAVGDEGVADRAHAAANRVDRPISEDGAALRGYYDEPRCRLHQRPGACIGATPPCPTAPA